MNWIVKILEVVPYSITCLWNDGTVRMINLKELIDQKSKSHRSSFSQLKNAGRFSEVKCDGITIYWDNGIMITDEDGDKVPGPLDLDPQFLYSISKPIKKTELKQR